MFPTGYFPQHFFPPRYFAAEATGAQILDYALLADPLIDGLGASPILANVWYTLDICWGWGPTDPAAAITTTLTCPGATLDTAFVSAYHGHSVGANGRTGVDLGFAPNAKAVYLSPRECALGFWRIKFPSVGSYTVSLSTVGSFSVTAGTAPTVTSPTWTVTHPMPMNRAPAKVGTLSFNGSYPASGLDMTEAQIGLYGVLFGDILPAYPYYFSWSSNKLHVFTSSGEVSGGTSINFSTTALFIGVGL